MTLDAYVQPSAMAKFEKTAKWPDGTQIVEAFSNIEVGPGRDKATLIGPNSSGSGIYQSKYAGLAMMVKDKIRIPDAPCHARRTRVVTRGEHAHNPPRGPFPVAACPEEETMKLWGSVGLVTVGLLGLGVIAAAPANAAPLPGFMGATPSSVAGCPYLEWRVVNNANGQVHGIVYYSDLSGLSNVTGTIASDGKFSLTLTKTSIGNGPVGTVEGTATSDGHIMATLTGEGCANNKVNIRPMKNLNDIRDMRGGER